MIYEGVDYMTWDDIIAEIYDPNFLPKYEHARTLPDDHVFDENQSVRWNKDKVKEYNETVRKAEEDYNYKLRKVNETFQRWVLQAIQKEIHVSEAVALIIFNRAWEDGHADGYHSVLYHAEEYCEFINKILTTIKKEG